MRSTAPALALAALSAASTAGAQALPRPVDLCGRAVSVARGADGSLALEGVAGAEALGSGEVTLERAALPGGAAALVRVTREGVPARGALVACGNGRAPAVLWQGSLAWRGEDVGDRVRSELLAGDLDGDGRAEVAVAERRESPRLCGVGATLADARRVDAARGALVPVGVDPLREAPPVHAEAVRPEAVEPARPALSPRAAQASSGDARALFDLDAATLWRPAPGGFATASLPSTAVVVRAVDVRLPAAPAVAMRRFTLVTEPGPRRFDVELAGPAPAGRVWRLVLPTNAPARCVSIVSRAPDGAALADASLRTTLDDGQVTLRALAQAADAADGDASALLLVQLGAPGMTALAGAMEGMSTAGARRAARLLEASRDPAVFALLAAALEREDVAVAAADSLRRIGAPALPALSAMVVDHPQVSPVVAGSSAPVLERLRAMAPALGAEGDAWRAAKGALGQLLALAAREGRGGEWLAMIPEPPRARARALRLTAEAFTDVATRARAAEMARALWADTRGVEGDEAWALRYRLLAPLAGDAGGVEVLAELLGHAEDHDLRAEAARALGTARTEPSTTALREALGDRAPRVRAAAAAALEGREGVTSALANALARDAWPTVQAAAARALARDAGATSALVGALDARSVVTVRAAIEALSTHPGDARAALVAVVDDGRRNPELRREAATALGERCDRSASNDLERVATSLTDPALPAHEQAIGHAALASLARLDRARAEAWLGRAEANGEARASVARAASRPCAR